MTGTPGPTLADTCVVIPTYNESQNIRGLVEALRKLSPALRIIVVDDGSPDGTGALADELAARSSPMRVVHRRGKSGRGSACLAGLALALSDPAVRCVVEMDADFSHDPRELPDMVRALETADVVIRSRYRPGSSIRRWGLSRKVFSRLANVFARRALGIPLTDFTNGYRAYTRAAAQAIEPGGIDSSGYIVLSEVAFQLHRKGLRLVELPSLFVNRRRGESNLGPREVLGAFAGILRLILKRVTS
ncbi:MAG: polyprenol monophosphomannose synthase [Elusimicrobia bacterium]|nr:polyprenol monophosphomannose synthase [Elusimicrobiota bacterium]